MDVLIATLASSETTILETTYSSPDQLKLSKFTVEITNGECPFGGLLDIIQLIGTSLNRDPVLVTGETFQFGSLHCQYRLKSAQVSFRH